LSTRRRATTFASMLVGALVTMPSVCVAQAVKNVTTEQCGVDFKKPAQRVFADVNGDSHWTEFRDARSIPELNIDEGLMARLWPGTDGKTLVLIEYDGQDFGKNTEYCFDKDGVLTQMRYEIVTAWGWGYRENGHVKDKMLVTEAKEFFDNKTRAIIPEPVGQNVEPAFLTPKLYLKMSDLPFAKLLAPPKAQ